MCKNNNNVKKKTNCYNYINEITTVTLVVFSLKASLKITNIPLNEASLIPSE